LLLLLIGQAGAEDPNDSCFAENDDALKSWQTGSIRPFGSVWQLANRRGATQTSTRGACEHAIGMHDVDVFFVATFRAFATASAGHQFGSWAWRPELDYFAQRILLPSFLPLFNVAAPE